jgi:hypothetical protein
MTAGLFDTRLRAMRRDRAARVGPELFLYERVFDDCRDRIAMMQRRFDRALLIGCPDPRFAEALLQVANSVDALDPGSLIAAAMGGEPLVEDQWTPEPGQYDLIVAVGTLDTVNDLPRALLAMRFALAPNGLAIGALSGGETLPQLRQAMRAADAAGGLAVPHVHPRIEPAAFTGLLSAAGFERPVVDIDRVPVSYRSFGRLVSDLRRMAATNLLSARARTPLTRRQVEAAHATFAAAGKDGRTTEIFEIMHFAAWTAADQQEG